MKSKIKSLSLDLETYSSVELGKSGIYRYIESPDFEVLLVGYSIDGGDVQVVDLAGGEKLPDEIHSALIDPTVTKWVFNAQFERICLSKWLGFPTGKYLDPQSWRCSMVWSAYMGLPLSLEGTGAVLGLEKQKLTEGKDLIRFFCKPCNPTATNGGRTRNLPIHAPDKWLAFKEYNRRDVQSEMAIQQKLTNFPVPENIWVEYHLDQEINDRGVALDMEHVQQAIEADKRSRSELIRLMRELTELENPNSVAQMKEWLSANGLETDTLGKKAVAEMLKTAPKQLGEVLTLRQQLAKSSIKKYQAMENAVCSDGRARGMAQFYGANRTGRFAGRLIQLQNLPQNHMGDLHQARSLLKSGNFEALSMLYDSVPNVLSELIRTAFIPKPGCKFIVADFSSIERVVLAWIAGEKWVLDAYIAKKDLYIATASQMFNVPVEQIDKKNPLRQKGKVADLACVAQGQLVLTDDGLVPIENVTTSHRVWDGEEWVSHEGAVFRGERETVCTDGVICTPDHLILTNRGWVESGKAVGFNWAEVRSPYRFEILHTKERTIMPPRPAGIKPVYDLLNCGTRHRFAVWNGYRLCLVHNCGYGGSVGALKAMGALDMGIAEEELKPLVDAWRSANPNIVRLWWDVDRAAMTAVRDRTVTETHGIRFGYQSGMLFITLPSGRRLCYVKPRIGTNRFGSDCVTYEGIGLTKKWERIETYGAKIVENCLAGDALVLTQRGWIVIEKVRATDKVWDGEKWITHDGLISKGIQETIAVDGVKMTSEHKVLTESGWIHASSCQGHNRYEVRIPVGYSVCGFRRKKIFLARSLRMWERAYLASKGFLCEHLVWLLEKGFNWVYTHDARQIKAPSLLGMAVDAGQVSSSLTSGVEKLRRSWDTRMSGMGRKFRGFLARYGKHLSAWVDTGARGRKRQLQQRELPMDNYESSKPKQALQPHCRFPAWTDDRSGIIRAERYRSHNASLSAVARGADRAFTTEAGCDEQVYDLKNCGNLHRFTVLGNKGAFIVHNCVQAISRDILCHAMRRLDGAGLCIVMHVHDEVVIEAPPDVSPEDVCRLMSETPSWAKGLPLRADGFECNFYQKN